MAGGTKTFVNNTDFNLSIRLIVRAGTNIKQDSGEERFKLNKGESKSVSYGSDTNDPFLNAIRFAWSEKGARMREIQRVEVQSGQFDDLLNTNSKITFHGTCQSHLSGSN